MAGYKPWGNKESDMTEPLSKQTRCVRPGMLQQLLAKRRCPSTLSYKALFSLESSAFAILTPSGPPPPSGFTVFSPRALLASHTTDYVCAVSIIDKQPERKLREGRVLSASCFTPTPG